MAERSFLGDMLTTLFERSPSLFVARDKRTLQEICLSLLDTKAEVSGLHLAQAALDRYALLTDEEKLEFFQFLNTDLDIDVDSAAEALAGYRRDSNPAAFRAFSKLAEPKRWELFRRLNQPPNATRRLVQMRADLLRTLREHPELQRTDHDFQQLLRSWFNRGFLVLRQISWETPASILDKIVEYEAVHQISDWEDLRRRLYPQDRRCFAYFHPTMPDEPLIFVEIALTMNVPNSIQHLLSDKRETRNAQDTKVAVFYSISNCQSGLKGVSFGNLLIKQVVDELSQELPNIETFVTLSPIPGMSQWLEAEQAEDQLAADAVSGAASEDDIRQLAVEYLLTAKDRTGAPLDPVARFHLGNGAQIHAVHAGADTSEAGQARSRGAMVNYHYDLKLIEQNHERYVQASTIATAPAFKPTTRPKQTRKRA